MPLIQFVFVIFGCIEKLTDAGAGSSYRLIFLNSHSTKNMRRYVNKTGIND